MGLPNPSMTFTPFDILTAQEMNDLVENDQALAAGTGLNNGVITGGKIANTTIANANIVNDTIEAEKIKYSTVPAFRAILTASQNGASASFIINLNGESFDNQSTFNTSTYRFVAPYAGIYHFSWNLHSTAGTDLLSAIYKNGSIAARGSWIKGSTFIASSGSTSLSLAANDYIQLACENVGPTRTIDGDANGIFTYLSGHLVAKL